MVSITSRSPVITRKLIYTINVVTSVIAKFRAASDRREYISDEYCAIKLRYAGGVERPKGWPSSTGKIASLNYVSEALLPTYDDGVGPNHPL